MSALSDYQKMKTRLWDLECMLPGIVFAHAIRADAAIDSLKCCGNCDWRNVEACENEGNDLDHVYIIAPDAHCLFTPSRWRERNA